MDQIRDAVETKFQHVFKAKDPRSDTGLYIVSRLRDDLCAWVIPEDAGQPLPGIARVPRERQRHNPVLATFVLAADAVGRVRAAPQFAIEQPGFIVIGHVAD